MDAMNYLSLVSALNYNNGIQGLYNYNPYSASNLYGSSDSSNSFGDIFGSCVNALQTSNTSLLSNLASSISSNGSNTDIKQLTDNLEEASRDTCDCKSADLVKELYSNYLSNSITYTKNKLNPVSASASSKTTETTTPQTNTFSSIPSEEEIESMINASISLPA